MAMTAAVKDELSRVVVTKVSAPEGRGGGAAAVRRRAAHRGRPGRRRGRAGHRRRWPAGCAGRSASSTGTPPRCTCSPPAGCARAPATSCGWSAAATALARQTGLLDQRGRPVRGLPPQVVAGSRVRRRGRLARGVPRPRLAHRARPQRLAGGHLPGAGGRAGAGRRGPPAGHRGQGARGARRGPGGGPRRRRDRRAADPARRAHLGAGLGGAPDAPRGAGDREPAGQLRRRQPAPLGPGRGGRGGPGRAGAGDPRRRGARPPVAGRAAAASPTARRPWRSSASSPTRR